MATQADDVILDDEPEAADETVEQHTDASTHANADADDEVDIISLGSDEVTGADEPEGMRNLRARLREVERENKQLKTPAPAVDDAGPEPVMDDYWENPDQYRTDLLAWNDRKRKADEAASESEKLSQSVSEDVEAGVRAYQDQRSSLRVPGYDAADDKVIEALPEIFLNALNLAGGEKAAALRFYLGTHDAELAKFAVLNPRKISDVLKAAGMAGAMAEKINVQRRKPATTPDVNHSARGGSGGGNGAAGKTIERLEREAARTGDRTQLIAYRRQLREGAPT